MKTPQQIKNEVEKEIKRCNEIIKNTRIDMKKEIWENKLLQHKAKLSILTEYDKSIKEMILKWLNANTKGLSVKTREEFIFSYNDILEIIDELILSKIWDNSEVEK